VLLVLLIQRKTGGRTYPKKSEKGRPRSRAKDHNWRDAVATSVIVLAVRVRTRMAVIVFVPGKLSVAL
jgi:hypothetical protein